MNLCDDEYLDATSKNVDKGLPLKVLREITKAIPFTSQGFRAVDILTFFDLAGSVITSRRYVTKHVKSFTRSLRLAECPEGVHAGSVIYAAYK